MMVKKINIRPTTSVYATYRNLSYDPWTAIAEFVDNSTQSYYDNIEKLRETKYWKGLNVDISYTRDEKQGDMLVIKDNACGMDFNDFQRAIVLDSPPQKRSRSEFGMGLKTAACWFGMCWSVETTSLGSDVKYYAEIDVELLRKNRNEEIEVHEDVCHPREHYTIVKIWKLNHRLIGRQIKKTKDKLSGIYRVDLRNKDINIYYNGEALTYEEPKRLVEQLPNGGSKIWEEKVDFEVEHESGKYRVYGFIALRETASTSNAGFALIRFGRVIVGGYENNYRPEEIFEKSNSFIYQRLFGELNMDDWSVTNTKDAFAWHNGLEDAFIDKLNEICFEYKKKAREYRKTNSPDVEANIDKVADQFAQAGIISNVNISTITQKQKEVMLPTVCRDQENGFPVEDLTVNNGIAEHENAVVKHKRDDSRRIVFERNGKTYSINLLVQEDEPSRHWLYISKIDGEYIVEWNIRHPFFKQLVRDQELMDTMALFIFAFSFAEIEATLARDDGMIDASDIRLNMNELLKKVMGEGR